eukprot:m.64995 g.64995  ORF g.64995 m.64995 type:complete len:572 (+) comp13631_c0_seq2:199-1914(+)
MARRRSVLAAAAVVAEATAVAEMSAAATSSAAAASSVAGVDGDSDGGGGGGPPGGAGTVVLEEDLPALGWAVSGKLDEDPEFCRILDKLMVPDLPPGMTRIPSAPSSFFAPGSKEARAFALVEQQQREQATQDASAAAAAASAEGGTVEDDNVATNAYNSGFVDPADLHLWGLGRVEKRNIDMLCRSGMCEHNYFGVNRSRAKVPKPIVDLLNLCRCNVFCYPGGEKRDSLSKTAENCAAAYQWLHGFIEAFLRCPGHNKFWYKVSAALPSQPKLSAAGGGSASKVALATMERKERKSTKSLVPVCVQRRMETVPKPGSVEPRTNAQGQVVSYRAQLPAVKKRNLTKKKGRAHRLREYAGQIEVCRCNCAGAWKVHFSHHKAVDACLDDLRNHLAGGSGTVKAEQGHVALDDPFAAAIGAAARGAGAAAAAAAASVGIKSEPCFEAPTLKTIKTQPFPCPESGADAESQQPQLQTVCGPPPPPLLLGVVKAEGGAGTPEPASAPAPGAPVAAAAAAPATVPGPGQLPPSLLVPMPSFPSYSFDFPLDTQLSIDGHHIPAEPTFDVTDERFF